jgi:hypothetical protein
MVKKEPTKPVIKDQTYKSNHKAYTTIEPPRTKSALQMSSGEHVHHGSNKKHTSSVERPPDFANQKHIAAFESSGKYCIDLQDV